MTALRVCEDPVFIIGSPRSGTSVLAWSLAHHPSFWTSRETHFLDPLFSAGVPDAYARGAGPDGWLHEQGVERAEFTRYVGAGLNALFTNRSGGRRWIDQTPANTMVLDQLAEAFPGAAFVHAVRDGRSVVHSMRHFALRLGANIGDPARLPTWARDFKTAVQTWRAFVEAAAGFCGRHPSRCAVLRLEDAVAEPVAAFTQLLAFLGEPYNHDPARFFASGRINSSFGDAAGYGPVHGPGLAPWESWTAGERELFSEIAGAWLERLGYAPATQVGGR